MRRYLFIMLLLLAVPFASADLTTSLELHWSFDDTNISSDDPLDLHNSYDGASQGTPATGQPGIQGESFLYDGATDWTDVGRMINSSNWTINIWYNSSGTPGLERLYGQSQPGGTALDFSMGFYLNNQENVTFEMGAGWNGYNVDNAPRSATGWNMITWVHDKSTTRNYIYWNGVRSNLTHSVNGSKYESVPDDAPRNYNLDIGGERNGARLYNGWLDEFSLWSTDLTASDISNLYNSGAGCSYYDFPDDCNPAAPAPNSTNVSERLQQDSEIEQNLSVSVNSVSYVPIYSSSITLDDTGYVYAFASVPIIPTASNTATCRITRNGTEFNESEASRSLTAGEAGNLVLSSFAENLTAGTYSFGVDCYRTGGGAFSVENSTLSLSIMTSSDSEALTYDDFNITGSVSGLITTESLTTSENYTNVNLTRAFVLELAAGLTYSATGNITITPEIAGTNCTPIIRYGASGSTGSIYGACHVEGLNNDTSYDLKLHGAGSGTIDAKAHLKEFIIHPSEINTTSLSGIIINSSNQALATAAVTIDGTHSTPNLVGLSCLNVVSNTGTETATFYMSETNENSSFVSRGTTAGQPGVATSQKSYSGASGTETLTLYGSCTDCTLVGGDLVTFISGGVISTPNQFIVTANNIYGGTISEFGINLSDGRTFTTTSGSISVPAVNGTLSISATEDGSAAIPYFTNQSLNHDVTADIALNLTPYTIINATFGGAKVNNFSVNGTDTTTGGVYVRIEDSTALVTIGNATADDGTNLSTQSANVTASKYLESYTFTMLTANAFNFSIYDEITEALITQNMTIEIISDASAGTYTTTNGTYYLELLTPTNYTIRYYSTLDTNYTQRDFIQVLTDRERYEIDLYALEDSEATDMVVTIKDTGGDPVENAIVKILRYYTSCNCYNVVEMATTSASGEAYMIVDAYDGHYKFAVEYEGTSRFISTSPENFVPSSGLVSRTITINLGQAYFESFRELTGITRSVVYNNDTKGLSFTWDDPSGIVTQGCLYASYLSGVHYVAVTPACQGASTGSVVLTLNNSANSFKYYAELSTSTTYSEYVVFSGVIDKIRDTLLSDVRVGAFFAAGMIIVLALMFSFSAIAVMIITAIGVIGITALGFVTLSMGFVTGFAAIVIGIAAYLMRS